MGADPGRAAARRPRHRGRVPRSRTSSGSGRRPGSAAGNGRLHPDSQGLTMATFRQTTSRADDPQLHTHVVISAKVQTDDGRWLALDARYLKRYQRMLGGLYQSVLRNELTHQLGVAWSTIEHGQAEIARRPRRAVRRLLEANRRGRAGGRRQARRVHRPPGTRTEPVGARRPQARGRRRHPIHEDRQPCRRTDDTVGRAKPPTLGWTGPDLLAAAIDAGRDQPAPAPTVDVNEIVAALSTGGSTWNRADVVSALCDTARPNPGVDGPAVGSDRRARQPTR